MKFSIFYGAKHLTDIFPEEDENINILLNQICDQFIRAERYIFTFRKADATRKVRPDGVYLKMKEEGPSFYFFSDDKKQYLVSEIIKQTPETWSDQTLYDYFSLSPLDYIKVEILRVSKSNPNSILNMPLQ